jgi:hypothetical protein
MLVDSTGLKLGGGGEWLIEKHGKSRRRSWRKLHIGIDANSREIVAIEVTGKDIDDAAMVDALLDQIADPIASFTADGGYDQDRVSQAVAKRHPDAAVIVPPRVLSAFAPMCIADRVSLRYEVPWQGWLECDVLRAVRRRYRSDQSARPTDIAGFDAATAASSSMSAAQAF